MKKFRKLLSVVLSIAMIMTMTTVLLPNAAMAANVKMGVVGDGSSNYTISLFNNYQNAVVEHDVPGTAGKAADDVFYRITRTEDPVGGEANTGIAENFGFTYGKKALMSFDVMFSSPNAQFCFGYGASVENATGSGQGTFTNLYVMSIGTAFGLKKQSGMASIPDNAPTSLSSNQWHNIAIEVLNDGTPAINVYIDGEKYACQLTANSWGVRHGRISISAGTVCLDNYYYNLDTAYDNTPYKVNDITVTPTEKFEYNAETKEFKILADDLTVAELKTAFSTEYDMDIYEDASYQTLLSDSDYVTQTSVLVVKNGNGAYRYYKAVRENNSLFNIAENGDGVSCTVTGLKEKLAKDSLATIEIPEKIAGYTVTAIGREAFKEGGSTSENYKSIASVTLPDTIKTIGDSAFHDCYALSSINFPEGLETIGASAFVHAGAIAGAFPSTLKTIKYSAFEFSGVKDVVFNDGLMSIGASAFHWTGGVSEAVFPDSLTYLGDNAIKTGTGLTKVRFPRNESFTEIPANTFSVDYPADSTKVTLFKSMSIYIPENITEIPANMLKHFNDGAAVKIYGSMGSEAYNFYETTKAAIDAGTYTNERGGKIGSLTFVDYDFETDTENVVNDSWYNKGDKDITLGSQEATTAITIGAPGVGGKTEDDVVIKLDTLGGDGGHNFVGLDGYKREELVQEFSICTPSAGNIVRVQLGYWTTESGTTDYWNNDILEITSGGIKSASLVGGTMLCKTDPGQWNHIAVVIPAGGSTELKVYINGERNTLTLPSACYGTRHFRIYPVKASETFNVYYDNIRYYTSATLRYNPKWDAKAKVTSTDSEIKVFEGEGIIIDKSVTAGELKAALKTNISAKANIRVYQDSSFSHELSDDETVPDLAVVVAAATNGASIEKSYTYYYVNPPINDTFYSISVNADGKTATVTGFNRDRITETDDLSAIAIPEVIAGYTITAIGGSAFKDETEIQSVVLPDTVEQIGARAFAGSQVQSSASGNITSVILPKNLKSIGDQAFAYNSRLYYIDLPDGLESVGTQAFYWSGLKSISIPDSVTKMGNGVFRLCSSLEYAKLPSGVTTIPAETFYAGSSQLKEIVIPETVTGAANTNFILDYDAIDPIIYGVYGSWAETFANEHGYEFVNVVANTIVAGRAFMGDGTKEIAGTSYDLKYGYEKIYFNGNLINIGQTDTKATVILAMYDETGKMVERNSLDVTIPASQTVEISNENNLYISGAKLKDGYTLKNFVWRKSNNEPISAAYVVNMDETKKEIHVLAIANSFCNDSFGYLEGICKADGVTIKAQNMYIGGAKITQHFNNLYGNLPAYQPVINMNYGENGMRMKDALESDKWDFVALQAATHGANSNDFAFLDYGTYNHTVADNGSTKTFTTGEMYEYIRDYVAQYAPTATRMMHMSWGPNDSQSRLMYNGRFADAGEYPAARMAVYDAQKQAYKYAASIYSTEDYMLVPTSEAVQYAINTLGFAEQVEDANPDDQYYDSSARALYRDTTCHLTLPYGRVLVGLTWYEYLTGNDVTQNPYQISGISAEDMALLKQAAHYACTMAEYNPAQ